MRTATEITLDQIKGLSLDEMKKVYQATFGLAPTGYHVNNPDHYRVLFERHVSFGRTLKTFINQ